MIGTNPSWDKRVRIPREVVHELEFWQENLVSLNERYLGEPLTPVCATIANSDASSSACGAILKIDDSIYRAHKNFSMEESDLERVRSRPLRPQEFRTHDPRTNRTLGN